MLFKAHASVLDALARIHIPVFPAPSPLLDAFGGSAPDAPMALPTLLCLLLATRAQRCCVVLCSGVANTCTRRFAIFATSCTGSVGSSFPLGSTCAMPCITMSLLRRHIGRSPRTVAAIICRCIQGRVRHAHESVPLLHGYGEGAFGSSFLLLARMSACTPAVILSSTLRLEAVVQAGEESAATRISA